MSQMKFYSDLLIGQRRYEWKFQFKKDKMQQCERIFHTFFFLIHAYVIGVVSYTFNFTLPNEAFRLGARGLLRLVL